jgi:hypothetical protein
MVEFESLIGENIDKTVNFFRLIEYGFEFCKKSIMVKMLTAFVFKALFKCWSCNGILTTDCSILWCVNPLTIFFGWQVKL